PKHKSKDKSKKRQTEKVVRDHLAAAITGSKVEVITDSGRIDILTPVEVIEVKQVKRYKHAMGQVISYGFYYPQHGKRIHLYGQVSSKQRKLIIRECQAVQIKVTFEE
ncbi:MAG: KilA-N domain-containing protein, partial [Cyanobacteria bacterium J06631_2]